METKLRVLLASSVLPRATSGGELLLERHLLHEPRIELGLITEGNWRGGESSYTAVPKWLLRRFRPARFRKHLTTFQSRFGKVFPLHPMVSFARKFAPDVVLTVAHGRLFPYAKMIAQRVNCPLVSIYHDWWPAMVPAAEEKREDRHFRQLYAASQLVFSVSEEMLTLLGAHADARVLLPIPGESGRTPRRASDHGAFKILYAGRLNYPYQAAMSELASRLVGHERLQLILFGDASHWPSLALEELSRAGIYKGLCPPGDDRIEEATKEADVLLTHLSFDLSDAVRVETSFPSKMTDYFRRGKPVILWAPEYSAAARWVRNQDAGVLVTDPSPAALIAAVEHLAADSQLQCRLSARAETLSKSTVSRSTIQAKFIDGLAAVHGKANASRRASGSRIANG